ncbi:MAG TPA: nuclear transport factor 2 family protein [Gaiellaceae bacterium]|nr:nuclear transport factor 2 family protein [Gaiellaceae bacterium]
MERLAALGAALAVAAAGSGAALATTGSPSPAAVVRAWSKALNANDNRAAGELFARNARVVQGPLDAVLPTQALAVVFNSSLPCAGRIVAMTVKGERVVATFVLGHRPKHTCDGPGQKAAALFVVHEGRIVLWEQVAVPAASGPTA